MSKKQRDNHKEMRLERSDDNRRCASLRERGVDPDAWDAAWIQAAALWGRREDA